MQFYGNNISLFSMILYNLEFILHLSLDATKIIMKILYRKGKALRLFFQL